jgi:hypothetical protein
MFLLPLPTGRVLPSIKGQAAVIFAVLHAFAWVGMLCWGGGEVGRPPGSSAAAPGPTSWVGAEPYYYLLNFDSYNEALVTLVRGQSRIPPPPLPLAFALFLAFSKSY